jgi:hypothetical protein
MPRLAKGPIAGRSRAACLAWRAACSLACAPGVASAADEDLVYVVRKGDTLIGLGRTLLVDPRSWPELQRLNKIAEPRRIPIGTNLRIPVTLARAISAPARVIGVEGEARSGGTVLAPGATLGPGAEIVTGRDGFVTIELADGSRLVLQAQSRLRIREAGHYPELGAHRSAVEVERGRVESQAAPQQGGGRFEIRTPLATTAVRGTGFRVAADDAAKVTRSEVVTGSVAVAGTGAPVAVAAGFGTVVDESRRPIPPVRLLVAPDLSRLPTLQERVVFRFSLEPVAGARGYRAQLARDREFQAVVAEHASSIAEARFGGVPDGDYWLRVRALDERALEGADGYHAFRLKARPEPPFPAAPRNDGKASGDAVELRWTAAAEAATYRVQLARDAAFANLVADEPAVAATELRAGGLAPGDYFWRVASVRADRDQGPFGDAQRFTQKALSPVPEPPTADEDQLHFTWAAEPGQTFRLQVARDERFASLFADRTLAEPRVSLDRPEPGTYFMRVQATDPDGYVGPYTATQRFEVPPPPPPRWLLLLPLIFLL